MNTNFYQCLKFIQSPHKALLIQLSDCAARQNVRFKATAFIPWDISAPLQRLPQSISLMPVLCLTFRGVDYILSFSPLSESPLSGPNQHPNSKVNMLLTIKLTFGL